MARSRRQITVTGETIQLATYDSGTVNTQLDAARIAQLPQNGRNVLGLAQNTVPGMEAGGTRANGLMGEAMEYSQDGAPMTNRNFGSAGEYGAIDAARSGRGAGGAIRDTEFQRSVRHAGDGDSDDEVGNEPSPRFTL